MFIEGDKSSLDYSLYRRLYDSYTVIAVGSCDEVIHSVRSFQAQPTLHRLGCVGLIDCDGRSVDEKTILTAKDIHGFACC